MELRFDGLDKLMAKLESLGGDCDKALEKGTQKATRTVQNAAKMLCPVDVGVLRASIQSKTDAGEDGNTVGTVGTSVEYAPYVEFGTGLQGEASPAPPKAPLSLGYTLEKTSKVSDEAYEYKGQSAQPFLYPALANNRAAIQEDYAKELKKAVQGRRQAND